jgi:ParB family chromosome partitioning protein
VAKDLKAMLAMKLAENSQRHADAQQDMEFDAGRQHVKLPVDLIDTNPYQPRRIFPVAELEALASSISEMGLLQPVNVRKTGERYQIIAGERRLRAHKLLGRHSIEALISHAEDSDMAVQALAENIDREDLSDFEIGKALRQVENLFPSKKKLAESLGLVREDMYRYYAFEGLPDFIRAKMEDNPRVLSRAAAVELRRVLQKSEGNPVLTECLEESWALLETGSLGQSKLAAHLSRLIKERLTSGPADDRSIQHLAKDGKNVGTFSRDGKNLVLKLENGVLTEEQEQRLCSFVEELLALTA